MHALVEYLESRHSAFSVARLIMLSGVALRRYGPNDPDDPKVIERVSAMLDALLPPAEAAEAKKLLR